MAFTITSVIPVALDMLELTFSSALLTGPEFFSVDKYEIYYGSSPYVGTKLSPKIVINNKKLASSTTCLLGIPGLLSSELYTLVIKPLPQRDGSTNSGDITAKFVATTTKLDSLLTLIPSVYDKGYTSGVRQLLLALSRQLDEVGGPEKEYYV